MQSKGAVHICAIDLYLKEGTFDISINKVYDVRTYRHKRTYTKTGGSTMKTVTATELRGNIYKLLEEVLATGVPIEINKGGKKLRIVPVENVDKFNNLVYRPDAIQGDPDALIDIPWEVNLDLP